MATHLYPAGEKIVIVRTRQIVIVFLLATIAFLALAEPSLAQTSPTTPTTTTSGGGCSDYVGLTSRIVACTRDTLGNAMDKYFDPKSGFYPLVQKAITGFLTLGVAIYGLMAAFGMLEKVGRDTMVLVLKLAFITWCSANTPTLYNMSLDMMDASAAAVVRFAPDPSSPSGGEAEKAVCLGRMKEAAADSKERVIGPWLAIDCMIDSVIGIYIPATISDGAVPTKGAVGKWWNTKLDDKKSGMSRGLLNFFFSSMQSSIIGVILAVVGFIFVYSMAFLLVKALMVYLGGYLGVSFMMIFAPLFIPLILFRRTKDYFDKWFKLTLSFALQPVIILVFVCFTMLAVDLAMFSGDYSVMYRIAGNASRQNNFNVNQYLEDKQVITRAPAAAAYVKVNRETPEITGKDTGGLLQGSVVTECTHALMGKSKTNASAKDVCSDVFPLEWWRNSIDWKKMAAARSPAVEDPGPREGDPESMTAEDRKGRQISSEVMTAVIFAAITVFIMNGLLTVIPMVANDLVGDSFQSPNLYQMASQRAKGMDGIVGGLNSGIGNIMRGGGGGRR